jgi:hypothetical protein
MHLAPADGSAAGWNLFPQRDPVSGLVHSIDLLPL